MCFQCISETSVAEFLRCFYVPSKQSALYKLTSNQENIKQICKLEFLLVGSSTYFVQKLTC